MWKRLIIASQVVDKALELEEYNFGKIITEVEKQGINVVICENVEVHFGDIDENVFLVIDEDDVKRLKGVSAAIIVYSNKNIGNTNISGVDIIVEGFDDITYKFIEDIYKRHYKMPITVAETKRLIIREITLDDLEQLYDIYSDSDITTYTEGLYSDRNEEVEFTKAYIENMYGFYGYGVWVLEEKTSGRIIGRAGLSNRDIENEINVEIGYVVGKKFQRKGYAFEACTEILKFAENFGIENINCFVRPRNKPSIDLARKLGFVENGNVEIENIEHVWLKK